MKNILSQVFLIACLFVFSTVAFGQKAPRTADAVIKTLQEICKAYETKDTAVLLRLMTEDFTLTSSNGTISTRDDEIGELKSGKVTYQTFENRDMKVRLYGDKTAIVTGRTIVKGVYEKTAIDAEFQFTDTLVRRDGVWRIAASHASRINPKS